MATLFNANVRVAYQAGYFDGFYRIGDLLKQGNFGFGATDKNGGEFTLLGDKAYLTTHDGSTHIMPSGERTPYATVTDFMPEHVFTLDDMINEVEFENLLAPRVDKTNIAWAIRISGHFKSVISGASKIQKTPYRQLAEVLPEYNLLDHKDVIGTLVGFACPIYYEGINRIGYHYHFISDDRQRGGHVTNFTLGPSVEIALCSLPAFSVVLPEEPRFAALDLAKFYSTPELRKAFGSTR